MDHRTDAAPRPAGRPGRRTVTGLTVSVLCAVCALGTGAPARAGAPAEGGSSSARPAVWPVPQSLTTVSPGFAWPSRVRLVTAPGADASAVRLVRSVLRFAGVTDLVDEGHAGATVYVGSAGDATTDRALTALGRQGPEGLPSGGYVLATDGGRDGGHGGGHTVVLSGADDVGTYYAAQTLRQLLTPAEGGGRGRMPGVTVRDWPSMPLRGTIEGFYGAPWSAADRLAYLDFEARTKQNVYVYSPKDDPYLREKWREPYPADRLTELGTLVDRAVRDHVRFTYALSPGLSVCYSSADDEKALLAKLESVWDLGARDFVLPLDDIPVDTFNCPEDTEKFGSGEAAMGAAQAALLNRVRTDFATVHPDAGRLQTVPTAYASVQDKPYKKALREQLDPRIIVQWTGDGVISKTVTTELAEEATRVYGHDMLLWDNYPVNDYVTDRLLLGPLVGREPGIADVLQGITVNPMVQAVPSRIAGFTAADFAWNPAAYRPEASWDAAVDDLGGRAASALRVFADNNRSSVLDPRESPTLTPLVDGFWDAWDGGSPDGAADTLDTYFARMAAVPEELRAGLDEPGFLEQAGPWIDKLGAYGTAGRTAVRMLLAAHAGDSGQAARERAVLDEQRAAIGGTPQTVAPGVMDPFLDRAEQEAGPAAR